MKKSWNDINSLENLEIDWDYIPDPSNKRKSGRLTEKDIVKVLVEVQNIPIKLATISSVFDGLLVDVSSGGVCVSIPKDLPEYTQCKVSFILGQKRVVSRAIVCYSNKISEDYKIGLKFVDLEPDIEDFISELYSSKILMFRS